MALKDMKQVSKEMYLEILLMNLVAGAGQNKTVVIGVRQTKEALTTEIIAAMTGIKADILRLGQATPEMLEKVNNAARWIEDCNMGITSDSQHWNEMDRLYMQGLASMMKAEGYEVLVMLRKTDQ